MNQCHFGFSATRIEDLGARDYTLVTIIADHSGSTARFQTEMEGVIKDVIAACMKSSRADNLMIRLIKFASTHQEVHGFKLLSAINAADYNGVLAPGGMTALYDAVVDGIEATNKYGHDLLDKDFAVNGIVFVITDGVDNASTTGPNQVKKALQGAVSGDNMESFVSILIAVNPGDANASQALNDFQQKVGFTQFVPLQDASKNTFAKLAQFVSKSISSQTWHLANRSITALDNGSRHFVGSWSRSDPGTSRRPSDGKEEGCDQETTSEKGCQEEREEGCAKKAAKKGKKKAAAKKAPATKKHTKKKAPKTKAPKKSVKKAKAKRAVKKKAAPKAPAGGRRSAELCRLSWSPATLWSI